MKLDSATTRIYDGLPIVALLATPLAVALPFGWSVYTDLMQLTGIGWLALSSAIAATIALESIGITAGKTALDYYARSDRRWLVAALIMALYVAVIGIEVLNAAFTQIAGLSIIAILILSPSVYLLVALRTQLIEETESSRELRSEQIAQERKLREQDAQLQAELTKLKAHTESTIALREQEERFRVKAEARKVKHETKLPQLVVVPPGSNGTGPKQLENGQWACPHYPETCSYPPQPSKMAVAGHMRRHKEDKE